MPVYFIQAGEAGPVKIGTADDVQARLRELQCGNPISLTVLRTADGGRATEAALHKRFADRRLRGEWFEYSDEMLTVEVVASERNKPSRSALREWITANGRSPGDVAAACEVHVITVYKWMSGTSVPRRESMAAIAALTNGAVQPADFFSTPPQLRPESIGA